MDALFHRLLTTSPEPEPVAELTAFWPRLALAGHGLALPIERAVAGGFAADRLGYAFAAGYREALRQLVPALGETPAALCATEAGGAHPRAIQTRLTETAGRFTLSGDKVWVTLGTHATRLLVVASVGQDAQGRNRLVLCNLAVPRPGVTFTALPPTPFTPEIPHTGLHLHEVSVAPEERLPGDAYERYLKPFRTIEDLHVHAALLGWLVQLARRFAWPRTILEELLQLLTATRALGPAAPDDPTLHVALGGLLAGCRRLLGDLAPHWQSVDPATRARWERDRPLLAVAGKARAQRLEAAWLRLGPPT